MERCSVRIPGVSRVHGGCLKKWLWRGGGKKVALDNVLVSHGGVGGGGGVLGGVGFGGWSVGGGGGVCGWWLGWGVV